MIRKRIKKVINSVLHKFGLQIKGIQSRPLHVPDLKFTMQSALERCLKRGLVVESVIDVGASDGRWSKMCMQFFPDANYLLIEAQEGHKKSLIKFKKEHAKGDYILAAAGKNEGKIFFDNSDLFGGLASTTPFDNNCIEVPVVKLDNEIKKRNLKPPYLLKLDTHGFEIPILEGSKEIIKDCQLIIIETYNFKLTNESLRYFEMCDYMKKMGFSPIELVDFTLRNYDNSFWQMDTFFVPSNNKVFSYNSYM